MKISYVGNIGQTEANVEVEDFDRIPGQMDGLGEFDDMDGLGEFDDMDDLGEFEANVDVEDYNRVPGDLNGLADSLAEMEEDSVIFNAETGMSGVGFLDQGIFDQVSRSAKAGGNTLAKNASVRKKVAATPEIVAARRKCETQTGMNKIMCMTSVNARVTSETNKRLAAEARKASSKPQSFAVRGRPFAPGAAGPTRPAAKRFAGRQTVAKKRSSFLTRATKATGAAAKRTAANVQNEMAMRKLEQNKPTEAALRKIIIAAENTRRTIRFANAKKVRAAKKSPILAVKLRDSMKRKSIAGTNTQVAYTKALYQAETLARQALKMKDLAVRQLRRGNKDMAAKATIEYMQLAQKAITLADRAERTKQATATSRLSKTFKEQAKVITDAAATLVRKRGPNPESDKLRAQAQQLDANAAKLNQAGAVVARRPDMLPGMPSSKRIAQLANKYNIRATGKSGYTNNAALLTTLDGFANDPMAQVDDYEGTMNYYGNDIAGKIMADIEYTNVDAFEMGLGSLGESFLEKAGKVLGQVQKVTNTVQKAVGVAKKGYQTACAAAAMAGKKCPGAAKPPAIVKPPEAPAPADRPTFAVQKRPFTDDAMPATPPPKKSNMPLIIGGSAVALGAVAWFMFKPKAA